MRRVAAVAAVLVALGTLPSCADDEPLPDAEDVSSIDLTPSATLVIDGSADVDIEIPARSVLAIRNDDDEAHRLVGDAFDTGLLEPGDETHVTFAEPATIEWRDRSGDLTGTITVVEGASS